MSLPSSEVTSLVHRSTSQQSAAGPLSDVAVAEIESDVIAEESLDLMDQDEESLDSEEDGLRQLLLLQQTR